MKMNWILTSDRLPDPVGHQEYLVTVAHFPPSHKVRIVTIAEYEAREEKPPFWRGFTEDTGERVTAWMPLPEPYMRKEDEQ